MDNNQTLSPKTTKQYRGLANTFYKGIDGDITPDNMSGHLKELAYQYKPDVWRKLRCAIAFDQREKGYVVPAKLIDEQKYPSTILPSDRPYIAPKVKRVSEKDFTKLLSSTSNKNLQAALAIAKFTGCRPAEMLHIKSLGDNKFFIPSAKKTEDGLRGLDRIVEVPPKIANYLVQSLKRLSKLDPEKGQSALQKALYRAAKKLWPRRKKQIVFYSFRHQLASDLKSINMSNKERSYIMGHQSTESIGRYGSRRSGTGACSISAGASQDEVNSVRDTEVSDYFEKKAKFRKYKYPPQTSLIIIYK
jgi:integrase